MVSNLWSGLGGSDIPDPVHDPRCDDLRCPDCGALALDLEDIGYGRRRCTVCGCSGEAAAFDGMTLPCICGELEPIVPEGE